MEFNYSRHDLDKNEKSLERIFEILPGAVSWTIIFGLGLFSFFKPLLASVIMIAFILYWVLRLIYMNIFLIASYARLKIEEGTDWMERIRGIDEMGTYIASLCDARRKMDIRARISARIHCRQMIHLKDTGQAPPKSGDIHHLVIIPVIRETREVVEPGILRIKNGKFPSGRILVIIALEQAASGDVKEGMYSLAEECRAGLLDLLVVIHPAGLPGEARVKGANAAYAAKEARKYFDLHRIPYENIIVSCFDADSVPSEDYFGCLTYYFMITPERLKRSYQPIPVYHNNIWDVPSFARIIDIGTSFFELVEATNPKKLVTFSSHSMSFKASTDVGYWPVDMISDDSAIFWKAFIHYDGDYQTIPIYTRISMDIAVGKDIKETFSAIYKQKRRWAWGVENFPIVARAFLRSGKISLYKRVTYSYKLFDAFVSWATWSFLLAFMSWLPAVFANKEFASSTVYYTAPRIRAVIFGLASIGIVICMIISIMMLPGRRKKHNIARKIMHAIEWLSIPSIVMILSALPALDAQTRLLAGKYMEFLVTEKNRQKK